MPIEGYIFGKLLKTTCTQLYDGKAWRLNKDGGLVVEKRWLMGTLVEDDWRL